MAHDQELGNELRRIEEATRDLMVHDRELGNELRRIESEHCDTTNVVNAEFIQLRSQNQELLVQVEELRARLSKMEGRGFFKSMAQAIGIRN